MIHLRENPIGLDAVIHKVQKRLYERLTLKWGVEIFCFPRCYPILEDGKRLIKYFNPKGKDVDNLIYAEGNKFFFTATYKEESIPNQIKRYRTSIDLYSTVKLDEIYPLATGRNDNEAQTDVLQVLEGMSGDFKITEVVKDIENVYKGYEHRQSDDVHPYHCFRITLNVFNFSKEQIIC